jgi:hypothetical protein
VSALTETFGLWTDQDAVLWPERSHPPTYLSGAAFAVWNEVVRDGPPVGAGEGRDRIVDGLTARGLLGDLPAPLVAAVLSHEVAVAVGDGVLAWPADQPPPGPPSTARPDLRAVPRDDGSWLLVNAGNGLPLAATTGDVGALAAHAAARLTRPGADALALPLRAWRGADGVVLVTEAFPGSPSTAVEGFAAAPEPFVDLVGTAPRVDGAAVQGLVLDVSWVAANPDAGPLALTWVLACLFAALNPVATAGRYALLDSAHRLTQGRSVAWVAHAGELPDLLARLPGAGS